MYTHGSRFKEVTIVPVLAFMKAHQLHTSLIYSNTVKLLEEREIRTLVETVEEVRQQIDDVTLPSCES